MDVRALAPGFGAATAALLLAGVAFAHPVRHEATVDLGAFVECVVWRYVVEPRDTLGAIAERELGTVRRQKEILALNPGLDPDHVRAGLTLAMPPRAARCEEDAPRYVFFAWAPDPRGWTMPRRLADARVHEIGHGARLFAVPVDRLAALCEASGDRALCGKALLGDATVARSAPLRLLGALPDGDPTHRIVSRFEVVAVEEGRIELARRQEKRFDASGRELVRLVPVRRGPSILLRTGVFLLLVAGLGWAVWSTRPR